MNLSKKNLLLIFGVVLVALIIIIFSNSKLTAFAIKENDKDISVPDIKTGEEKIYLYNKYSNNSGVILSTPFYISCNWKPDGQDDGWKECTAIFEIDDKTTANKILTSPEIALNFKDGEEIRDIEISYSQDFKLIEETYVNLTKEIVVQNHEEEIEPINSLITGMAITEAETQNEKEQTNRQEKIQKLKEKLSTTEETTKTIIKHENTQFEKREFFDFSTAPIIENSTPESIVKENVTTQIIPTEPQNTTTENTTTENTTTTAENVTVQDTSPSPNISIQTTPEQLTEEENETNKTKDFIFKVNISEPKPEPEISPSIMGNVIKIIKPKDDFYLNTNKPFAIKITFEIPKYNSNSFNFSIYDKDFSAAIDPDISGCGTLNTEDSIYSLTQNVESVGACFTVTASNITVDCQGHSIRYNSAGSPAYGVYSTASSTKVKNCTILSGDLNNRAGAGIYFSGVADGEIHNNVITIDDITQEAILLESSPSVSISNNELDISKINSYGIYLTNSDSPNIENNEILSSSNVDTIYIDSSDNIAVTDNIFNTSGTASSAIYLISSLSSNIANNFITSYNNSQSGIYLDTCANSNMTNNTIFTFGKDSHGIYLKLFSSGNASENNISTTGNDAYGFFLAPSTNSTNFSKNTIRTTGLESNGFTMVLNSNSNIFNENNVIASGDASYAALVYQSDSSTFNNNSFQTLGEEGYGFWTYDSTNIDIQENTFNVSGQDSPALILDLTKNSNVNENILTTSGSNGYGIEIDSFSNSNIFSTNQINTSGDAASGIFFLTNSINNSFLASNIKTFGPNTYSLYVWGTNNSFEFSSTSFNSPTNLFISSGITQGIWNFTNTNLTKNWSSNSNGILNVMWKLEALATYDGGAPIPNVNITVSDAQEEEKFSLLTNENGRITNQILTEYTQLNSDEITYYSNYLIQASIPGEILTQPLNMTENKNLSLIFSSPISEVNVIESSSSGGSSGGGLTCIPEWECIIWSECLDNKQSRVCTDKNDCTTQTNKPDTERKCEKTTKGWDMRDILFDINLIVLEKNIDGLLSGSIGLINLGVPGEVSANLNYKVKDFTEQIVYEENEVVPVETQIEFIKEIDLSHFPDGEYTWIVELSYDGQTEPAQAQDTFTIGGKSSSNIWLIIFILLFIFTIILGLIFFIKKKKDTQELNSKIQQSPTIKQAPPIQAAQTPTENISPLLNPQ